jgi:hypothetical protein
MLRWDYTIAEIEELPDIITYTWHICLKKLNWVNSLIVYVKDAKRDSKLIWLILNKFFSIWSEVEKCPVKKNTSLMAVVGLHSSLIWENFCDLNGKLWLIAFFT